MRRIFPTIVVFRPLLQAAAASLLALPAAAQPPLNGQKSWGEKEKKEFVEFLRSGQKAAPPEGEVRGSAMLAAAPGRRTTRYLTLAFASDAMFTRGNGQGGRSEGLEPGFRAVYGRHLFSWVRGYGGVQYNPVRQRRLDDSTAKLSHWRVPLGVELALVPLGTPYTRYLVLRGGLCVHHVGGPASDAEFRASPLGTRLGWDFGLGYEWQFHDSPLRLTLAADGYRSMSSSRGAEFYGAGLNAGLTWTF